jgi:hypothetical protein
MPDSPRWGRTPSAALQEPNQATPVQRYDPTPVQRFTEQSRSHILDTWL